MTSDDEIEKQLRALRGSTWTPGRYDVVAALIRRLRDERDEALSRLATCELNSMHPLEGTRGHIELEARNKALDEAADKLMLAHRAVTTGMGHNPENYSSHYSLGAAMILALKSKEPT